MANNIKTNPVGREVIIAKIGKKLYEKLVGTTTPIVKQGIWKGVVLEGYPLCEPMEHTKNNNIRKTIEFVTPGKDNKGLIHGEGNKFFFTAIANEKTVDNVHWSSEVELFFILNTKKLNTDVANYDKSKARTDVVLILNTIADIKVKEIETKFDKVFEGYTYKQTDTMEPYHYFKIKITVFPYRIDETNC